MTTRLKISKHLLCILIVCAWVAIGCESRRPSVDRAMIEIDQDLAVEIDQDASEELDQDLTPESIDMQDYSIEFDVDQQVDSEIPTEPPPWSPPVGEQAGTFKLRVLLDNETITGALISQGGSELTWVSDEQGEAWIELDSLAISPLVMFAAHPEARTKSIEVQVAQIEGVTIALRRFRTPDQPQYPYSDPGEPSHRGTTAQCGHCHLNINDAWFASPHSGSAKNPIVYDLYSGRGSGHNSEEGCQDQGGVWTMAPIPGSEDFAEQCFFALSAIKAFNPECGTPCNTNDLDENAYFGGCADCHAPAVDGLDGGGHDLSKVKGRAFEYGVSCDFCHHVESVDLEAEAGVAGRLKIQRPRERGSPTLGGGGFKPLSFGPHADISNPRMGISPREHFRNGQLCGGCHQHQHKQEHNPPQIDRERWPEGELPNQSTYQEWLEGPLNQHQDQRVACNSCHMPPVATVMNSANLEYFTDADVGVQGGWPRPFGETRAHAWWGPRQAESPILSLSAHLSLSDLQIETNPDESTRILMTTATVSNTGAGHGLPTGEPMRHLLLLVEANCQGQVLMPSGGDVIHDIGGALAERTWAEALDDWPEAQVGDEIRVVRPANGFYDYDGYGAFRDPSLDQSRALDPNMRVFSVSDKGLRKEQAVGTARVTSINEGRLSLDKAIAAQPGDRVYLHRHDANQAMSYAGYSGFSFARVLTGDLAPSMLPHFVAQDLTRDNRIRPNQGWTSQHRFTLPQNCNQPQVQARLIYRPYPWWLATQRAWDMWDREIRSVTRHLNDSLFLELNSDIENWTANERLIHPEDEKVWISLPSELSLEAIIDRLSILRVSLDKSLKTQATRRAQAWPWEVKRYHPEQRDEQGHSTWTHLTQTDQVYGFIALFNDSDEPLVLEPISGLEQYGASLDFSPALSNALRTTPSRAEYLWVIPAHSGSLLVPTLPIDAQALMAAGYSAQGGRTWLDSTPLFTMHYDEAVMASETLSSARVPPHISRQTLLDSEASESNNSLRNLLGHSSLVLTYQGSEQVGRWHLNFQSKSNLVGRGLVVSIRNLSTKGHSFALFGHEHRQWQKGKGWSEPLMSSWVPIAGEILVRLPPLGTGIYQLGALNQTDLQAEFIIE